MLSFETAYSSHKKCFICGRKKNLKQVKNDSIILGLKNYKIIIKNHARCCSAHLDFNGIIKETEFKSIPTKFQTYQMESSLIMTAISNWGQSGIFDSFQDMNNVSEELCKKLTGWSKMEFIKFSKYITSVYDTAGRTKEQLIVIYRYWLRKGLDQLSLAMFKNNTSQHQISHYLTQIREAINKDFVPYFLGSKKNREFFLKHNNVTTTELHGMKEDQLAVFVDATYTRLEKSSNNEFQYKCWSMQKMDLLIKPFIICCADGYVIDCYGPFQANHNDAKILEYVLETDQELSKVLIPYKTLIFLDRGKCRYFFELILS
jgi:hypothetical protein